MLDRLRQEITSAAFRRLFFLLMAAIAVFFLFKVIVFYAVEDVHTLFGLGAFAMAAAGARLRMSDFVLPSRILLRTIFGLFGLYALAAYPTMPGDSLPPMDGLLLHYGRFFAAGFAVLSLFRPSFGLILLTYVLWFKGTLGHFIGTTLSVTDYMPLIEVATFLVIARMVQAVFEKRGWMDSVPPADDSTLATGEKIFLLAIAVHMANYFYSAHKKIVIGDHALSWVFENQTQALVSNADAYGQFPFSFSPFLTAFSHDALGAIVVLSNLLLFAGQLFSLFALFRIRWGVWTTLFYDLTHVVIFVASGIFFYKWIILNLSIVMALETMKRRIVTPGLQLLLMAMILASPLCFFVAHLGWWDTPQTNIEYFSAVTKDGRAVRIPSNYFGAFSIVLGQQRMIFDKSNGFVPTSTYGMTRDQRLMEQGLTCSIPLKAVHNHDVIAETFANPDNKITPFIQNYHRWVLSHAGADGHWLFDAYPHHIFSFPWGYDEFYALNLNDIVAYRYTVEAACVDVQDGKVAVTVQKEGHHDIPVSEP